MKIIGLDESGTIGDEYIIFCQVEFDEDVENDLFIHNLLNVNNFLFTNEISHNLSSKQIIKLCHQLNSTGYINVKFFKLHPQEQNLILKDALEFQGNFLFLNRSHLIQMYEREKIFKKPLNKIIRELRHYEDSLRYPDYCLKSYSFLYIMNHNCLDYKLCEFLKKEGNLIHAQIDGGNFFSFWWYNLIFSHENKDFLHNKLFVNGLANGDESYLSINIADLFAKAYQLNRTRFYDYRIQDVEYNFEKLPFSKDTFFQRIWPLFSKNVFKRRILLIGKADLFNLIPHILHIKDRSRYFEVFKIKGDIDYFFKRNSKGKPHENLVIYSKDLNEIDEENIQKCKKYKIEAKSINDFKKDFLNFFDVIEDSLTEYPDSTKTRLKDILNQKRSLLS